MEIPEVLIWSQEQNEERSPNLTTFTEHFNKMSYWVRTRILDQTDSRDREKYVMKFIKILKHLRKLNNFNSYLALLSALDSAPIRRLEWQKTITDGLKEYCALIDSSSSFRAYRNALAESSPPCIPYMCVRGEHCVPGMWALVWRVFGRWLQIWDVEPKLLLVCMQLKQE